MNLSQNILLILAALLNEDLTALDIIEKIKQRSGRALALGGIYSTLERMEDAKLVEGEYRLAEAEPGKQRPRRFYKILGAGRRALDEIDLVREGARRATS